MVRRGGGRFFRVLQVTLILGVASLGCQSQLTHSVLQPDRSDRDAAGAQANAQGDDGSSPAHGPVRMPGAVVRAAYNDDDGLPLATTKDGPKDQLPPLPRRSTTSTATSGDELLLPRMNVRVPETSPRRLAPGFVRADAAAARQPGGTRVPPPPPDDGETVVDGPVHGGPPIDPSSLPIPRELSYTYMPPYVIEPPDVLYINAIRMTPRPPYRIQPLDLLYITATSETDPTPLLSGQFTVSPDGAVGIAPYGSVQVMGLTLTQAAEAIRSRMRSRVKEPVVSVALAAFRGVQQTVGEHLVGMDGTITLGTYGCVNVTGLTLPQAKCAIERHLSKFLLNPEIALSVAAYNSKVYYVVTDGAGFGEQVYRFPITGKETVLDALGNIRGLPPMASKRIWVARPAPCNKGCYQILPVDWDVIVRAGDTCTNYQLFPGDRVYVKASTLITINNYLIKILSPIEQVFGVTLLGAATVNTIRAIGLNNNGNNNNNGTGTSGVIVPVP